MFDIKRVFLINRQKREKRKMPTNFFLFFFSFFFLGGGLESKNVQFQLCTAVEQSLNKHIKENKNTTYTLTHSTKRW